VRTRKKIKAAERENRRADLRSIPLSPMPTTRDRIHTHPLRATSVCIIPVQRIRRRRDEWDFGFPDGFGGGGFFGGEGARGHGEGGDVKDAGGAFDVGAVAALAACVEYDMILWSGEGILERGETNPP
jgi:hypothetical protein